MNKTYFWSWNPKSVGARLLAEALNIPRIRHRNSRFIPSPDRTIINWGSSTYPWAHKSLWEDWGNPLWLNDPDFVAVVSNKLKFFQTVSNHCRCVPWTVSRSVAQEWNQKSSVVVRNLLRSSSGSGILIVPPLSEVPQAPLYTKYIPKDAEYRIHFVGNEIIDVQKKVFNQSHGHPNWKVRSHNNGFIFIRQGFIVPGDILENSKMAFVSTGLDFGAVDVIWSEKRSQSFILEVNSAPGIMNSTVTKYADALRNLINQRN